MASNSAIGRVVSSRASGGAGAKNGPRYVASSAATIAGPASETDPWNSRARARSSSTAGGASQTSHAAAAAAGEVAANASASVAPAEGRVDDGAAVMAGGDRRAPSELHVDGAALAVAIRARRRALVRVDAGAQLADPVGRQDGAAGRRAERFREGRLAAGGPPGHADHAGQADAPGEALGHGEQLDRTGGTARPRPRR